MKKFNLFAIGVVAMLMAAVNVSAVSSNKAKGATEEYPALANCLIAKEDTCTLLAADSLPASITESATIKTNGFVLTAHSSGLTIQTGAELTIDGENKGGYLNMNSAALLF